MESNNVKARLRRATAYMKKKKLQEAKEDLDIVLKIEPTNKKGNVRVTHRKKNIKE